MLTYDEALEKILSSIEPLPSVAQALSDSKGRALLTDIYAPINLPPFSNSQMDGYALKSEDTQSASVSHPSIFQVINTVQAGPTSKELQIDAYQCVRIFTGAPLPETADAVVPQEDVERVNDNQIRLFSPCKRGSFIRNSGDDIAEGELILKSGRILSAGDIGLLSSLGFVSVPTGKKVRLALMVTGNEVVSSSNYSWDTGLKADEKEPKLTHAPKLEYGQIYESNLAIIRASLKSWVGIITASGTARDTEQDIVSALESILNNIRTRCDMIISCGGVSVGDYDCVKPAIKSMGGTIVFDSVAIRPGKPVTFGFLNDKPFFGLPGNPVSAMVTFELFVRPAILQMSGYPLEKCCRPQIDAILTEEISHEPGRRSFARGKVEFVDATIRVTPSGKQRSDQISGMAESNALIVIHEDSQTLPAESKVKVMLLD